jgi:hypothetical protein
VHRCFGSGKKSLQQTTQTSYAFWLVSDSRCKYASSLRPSASSPRRRASGDEATALGSAPSWSAWSSSPPGRRARLRMHAASRPSLLFRSPAQVAPPRRHPATICSSSRCSQPCFGSGLPRRVTLGAKLRHGRATPGAELHHSRAPSSGAELLHGRSRAPMAGLLLLLVRSLLEKLNFWDAMHSLCTT